MSKQPLEILQISFGMKDLQMIAQVQGDLRRNAPGGEFVDLAKGGTSQVARIGKDVMGHVTLSTISEELGENSVSQRLTMIIGENCVSQADREKVQEGLLDAAEQRARMDAIDRLSIVPNSGNLELLSSRGYRMVGSALIQSIEPLLLEKALDPNIITDGLS